MQTMICQATFCDHAFCNAVKKLDAASTFLKEFMQAPLTVGSVCPSSKALTSALVRSVSADDGGLIIDLGAGSGIVTEELLKSGIPPERIMAVEVSSGFSTLFHKRCPGVPLVIADARSLGSLITQHSSVNNVSAIISSLPLRVIPMDVVLEIMAEMRKVLSANGGIFIQYTYAWWMRYPLLRYGLKPHASRMVFGNLPPARVESYVI